MCAHIRTVHENGLGVRLARKFGQNLLPQRGLGPGVEAFVNGFPGAEFLGHISPLCAGAKNPEDAIEHEAGVLGRSASTFLPGRTDKWLKTLPEVVGDVVSAHWVMNMP